MVRSIAVSVFGLDLEYTVWFQMKISTDVVIKLLLIVNSQLLIVKEHVRHERIVGDEFERRIQTAFRADEKEKEEQCNVCLDKFGDTDVITNLRCNHTFHKECLRMCFRSNVSAIRKNLACIMRA